MSGFLLGEERVITVALRKTIGENITNKALVPSSRILFESI